VTTPIAKGRVIHFNPNAPTDANRDVVPFDAAICGAAPMFERIGVREVRRGGVVDQEPVYGNELGGFTHTRTRELVTCTHCLAALPAFDQKRAANPNLYPWL